VRISGTAASYVRFMAIALAVTLLAFILFSLVASAAILGPGGLCTTMLFWYGIAACFHLWFGADSRLGGS